MAYTRINWEDLPSTNTPINATNLNKMDKGIYDNDQAIATKATLSDIQDNLVNVSNEVDEDYRVNFLHSRNLLFKLPTTNTQNGITFTNNGDGTFNVSGTASAQAFFYFYATYNELGLSNGSTYTLSSNKAFPTGLYFQFEDYQGESTWKSSLLQIDNTQQTKTSSITLAGDRIRVGVRISNGATVNISNVGIILNSGSKIDYEPYITPSIYVDNEKYTDTLNVGSVVDSRSRVNVLHSKNLLNYNTSVNGVITVNSTSETLDANNTAITSAWIPCEPNTTYRLYNPNGTSARQRWQTKASNGTITYMGETNTLTTNSTAKYMRVYYYVRSTATSPSSITNVQIEKGSEFTGFEPYITPSIYVDNDEIYSKEEVLFSGNQSLSMSSTTLTLNKNITDYNLIEIYYTKYSGSDSILSSLKIAPINNGYISPQILFKATSNIIQQFWCLLKITTNTITLNDIGYVNYKISDNSVEVANNTGSFSIVKIIGYK